MGRHHQFQYPTFLFTNISDVNIIVHLICVAAQTLLQNFIATPQYYETTNPLVAVITFEMFNYLKLVTAGELVRSVLI